MRHVKRIWYTNHIGWRTLKVGAHAVTVWRSPFTITAGHWYKGAPQAHQLWPITLTRSEEKTP